ncbi:MAG: DUF1003 domain-containing protein [Acidobacteria bacterium]|nr:DUF1003 domain-containing protein [Acidobacteriota bacterium]
MTPQIEQVASRLLAEDRRKLTEIEKRFIRRLAERRLISANINQQFDEQLTFGQRVADQIASFGGSWPFIFLFFFTLLVWMAFNSFVLRDNAFDPFPYILLNLALSCLAALQAPVIMMSQNRQAAKDRLQAEQDYQVNLKSEFEISRLHEKVDALHAAYVAELKQVEERHTILLEEILALLEDQHDEDSGKPDIK